MAAVDPTGTDDAADAPASVPLDVRIAALGVGVSLLLALVMASPQLLRAARGELSFSTAGLRFVIALVLARVGVGVVVALWRGYRRAIDRRPA